jgi:hypothetical protein
MRGEAVVNETVEILRREKGALLRMTGAFSKFVYCVRKKKT